MDQKARNDQLVADFRASRGQVTGPEGAPLLVLTTTGARSGQPRTTPLVYLPDGERYIIFASHQGADKSPDWYHNLLARPRAWLEVGDEAFEAEAVLTRGEERDRLYARQVALHPRFGEYQRKTARTIPVVILRRI